MSGKEEKPVELGRKSLFQCADGKKGKLSLSSLKRIYGMWQEVRGGCEDEATSDPS